MAAETVETRAPTVAVMPAAATGAGAMVVEAETRGFSHPRSALRKGRGFCPRCGCRRMAERSAHLTGRVFPDAPVRQWVLCLPHRQRSLLAWDHGENRMARTE